MAWRADFSASAARELVAFEKPIRRAVLAKIVWLVDNFELLAPLPLHADWRGYYKLRVGDYRVMYKIEYETQLIRIEYIDRRDRAYKKKR